MSSKKILGLFIAVAALAFAAPARAVTIWLTLFPGQNPDSDAKAQAAQAQIVELLGPTASRRVSDGVLRYDAPTWSAQLDEAKRRAVVAGLVSAWGDKFRVDEASGASLVTSGPSAGAKSPADSVAKALDVVPAGIASGNQGAAYDGSAAHAGALAAPAAAVPAAASGASAYVPPEARMSLEKPAVSGIDLGALDRSVSPCADFYQFSCGGWLAANPIPADQSRWGRFTELMERNQATLKDILEKAAAAVNAKSADEKKLGDLYASCMDEKGIEDKGAAPLKPELARVSRLTSVKGLAAQTAHLHVKGISALFEFGPEQDYEDASMMIGGLDQGGIALPDRDYYLDAKYADDLKAYGEHVTKMFELSGDAPETARAESARVVAVETALAKISMDRVSRRDPAKTSHKMSLSAFEALTPSFDWKTYFAELGAPKMKLVNVDSLQFFQGLEKTLRSVSAADWKSYLRWQVIHDRATMLSSAFVSENFAFFGQRLSGQKTMTPRWKRCVRVADGTLSDALGRDFVARSFNGQAKDHALGMITDIESAMKDDISSAGWMSPQTQQKALAKLAQVANKIGYPDKWKDYSKLTITRGDALGNLDRAAAFDTRRDLAKIGKPTDRKEWGMTPPTVNAYYSPTQNNINFPAGILQPPFYDPKVDNAYNMGAIGAVAGHELTHAFDDQGRQYDGKGNLDDWWTAQDQANFEARAKGLVDQYSAFVAVKDPGGDPAKDVHVNGALTLGENTADNGGVRLAYAAYMKEQAAGTPQTLDGFTPQQRFFLGFGQIWCMNARPQAAKLLALTDPHSPSRARVDATLSNMAEFRQAFRCEAGDAMVNPKPARVW